MDGVLVDSEPFHIEIEKRLFELNHLSISPEEHHRYMGVASDVMWRGIAKNHSLNLPVETLIEQNRTETIRFFTEVKEIPLMPGIVNLLERLKKMNFSMAVASSSYPEVIELILQRTGLLPYFQVIVSSEEAGKSKPEPDVYLLAAKRLGVNPSDCLVIEDSANGIRAALAANMRCIAFEGPGANPDKQKEANQSIKSFDQLEV